MQRALESKVGFALLAGLYLLSFPYHPGLRSPNELCRLWQSRSLIDFGTLDINGTLSQLGAVGDLSCTAVVQGPDGQKLEPCVGPFAARAGVVARYYYPSKAPLVSFLGAPVYWVLKALGPVSELRQVLFSRLFVTVLPALGLLWLLRRFLVAYVSQPVADSLVVVYGLGTMAFAYAEAFMSHQLTAVLLFATFYVAWKIERGEWRERAYLLAGLLAGSVVAAEYTGALGVVCVAAYAVASRWKRWAALGRVAALVVAGAAPFLVALLAYHQACFGSPWTSGYKFLNDPSYQGWHEGGFLGIKGPDFLALWLSLFSPLRGLFTLSPVLLVAPFGFSDVRTKDPALLVFLLVLVAGNLYFTASFSYASWGWTVGPRHLTPMVPFLMLPVALVVERLTSGAGGLGRSLVAGLCVTSVAATGLVALVAYVPDDVSTSLWGLAVPLLTEGLWPVSWLAAWVPNPASGAVLEVLLVGVVLWLSARFIYQQRAMPLVVIVVVVGHFGLLRLATQNHSGDKGARAFLSQMWSAPVGQRLQF